MDQQDKYSLHAMFRGSLKAAAWERAKGALRELVAIDGSNHDPGDDIHRREKPRFEEVEEAVDAFIKSFEEEGLHE